MIRIKVVYIEKRILKTVFDKIHQYDNIGAVDLSDKNVIRDIKSTYAEMLKAGEIKI